MEILVRQECIPVGCVPSAAAAICRGGGCVCFPGGLCFQGVLPRGDVCASRGCGIPACTEADTPPVDRHTPVKT